MKGKWVYPFTLSELMRRAREMDRKHTLAEIEKYRALKESGKPKADML